MGQKSRVSTNISMDMHYFVCESRLMPKKSIIPIIRCKCCKGTGEVELSSTYQSVYDVIKRKAQQPFAKIYAQMPERIEKNNLMNQLLYLVQVGLVQRTRVASKVYLYTVAIPTKQ